MAIGLLLVRIGLGAALLLQGKAKLTRAGRRATADYFDGLGFRPAGVLATITGLTEVASGLLLLSGLATWLAAAGALGVLVGAAAVCWERGWANSGGGAEYPTVAAFVSAALAFTGAGTLSVDHVLGWSSPAPMTALGAVAIGIGTALPLLHQRRRTLARRTAVAVVALVEAA